MAEPVPVLARRGQLSILNYAAVVSPKIPNQHPSLGVLCESWCADFKLRLHVAFCLGRQCEQQCVPPSGLADTVGCGRHAPAKAAGVRGGRGDGDGVGAAAAPPAAAGAGVCAVRPSTGWWADLSAD